MNSNIILNNAGLLARQYYSDPKHLSESSQRAKYQMKQLTVFERKIIEKLGKGTYTGDDDSLQNLALRIVAVQNPRYISFRTQGKLASFARSLKNLFFNRPCTKYILAKALNFPLTQEAPKAKEEIPFPLGLPSDLPPELPPVRTKTQQNQAELHSAHSILDKVMELLTNKIAKEDFESTVQTIVGDFIRSYYENVNSSLLPAIATSLNIALKKQYSIKEEAYQAIRARYEHEKFAIDFLEKHWE